MEGSLILGITYGFDVKTGNDAHVLRAEKGMYAMGQAAYGYSIDYFPSFKYIPAWFPGGYFKIQAAEWRKYVQDMAHVPFALVKRWMEEGNAPESIAVKLLNDVADTGSLEDVEHQETMAMDILGSAYAGEWHFLVEMSLRLSMALTYFSGLRYCMGFLFASQFRLTSQQDGLCGSIFLLGHGSLS